MTGSAWIKRIPGEGPVRQQLVCLPHAGGGASAFRPWRPLLPPEVELLAVQYPGREDRTGEPALTDLAELAEAAADALAEVLDAPYTVFGHSMGALVGYELLNVVRQNGFPAPRRLIVSSQFPPGLLPDRGVRDFGDEAVLDLVDWLAGGTSGIRADSRLSAFVAGLVRADYEAVETYRPAAAEITVPVNAFCGAEDPAVSPDEVAGWAAWCRAGFDRTVFPGGHFYLREAAAETVAAITGILRREDVLA
ncbi:thioesterase [Amycolatopsis sp. A1MSW2902]|uniref:thioesterase II family protein n=2 Tax=Amycolatopsis sp. A1MSW2902 TaxID=687413 RepID=UPI00307FC723